MKKQNQIQGGPCLGPLIFLAWMMAFSEPCFAGSCVYLQINGGYAGSALKSGERPWGWQDGFDMGLSAGFEYDHWLLELGYLGSYRLYACPNGRTLYRLFSSQSVELSGGRDVLEWSGFSGAWTVQALGGVSANLANYYQTEMNFFYLCGLCRFQMLYVPEGFPWLGILLQVPVRLDFIDAESVSVDVGLKLGIQYRLDFGR